MLFLKMKTFFTISLIFIEFGLKSSLIRGSVAMKSTGETVEKVKFENLLAHHAWFF